MLKISTRQKYLRYLGFYKGKITGVEDAETKSAYKKLQQRYFIRSSDIDGLYGPNTDKLLVNARRVQFRAKNFKLEEFKCECGGKYCTGYPVYISRTLLINIQKLRNKYKSPMMITSGIRCQKLNDSLVGSIPTSKHTKGKAIDFYGSMTNTRAKRQDVIKQWGKYSGSSYAYSDTPNMGTSVHVDVK